MGPGCCNRHDGYSLRDPLGSGAGTAQDRETWIHPLASCGSSRQSNLEWNRGGRTGAVAGDCGADQDNRYLASRQHGVAQD